MAAVWRRVRETPDRWPASVAYAYDLMLSADSITLFPG
ncbi:MAG: hypothetical protein AVDCRST_MAG73-3258 [uncultured Thermomicrobiales bacterium]|uniref:Uncharacterized protein n=1 Tax=uncultured Thermomicrobiales bacterium TaxID=1645740 RepID=A0A6J4UQU3_9BACT|nr:MAG: hypothetical protein AVDCRST_MAG73-3258 [uncultured Thermomicrobiales bacterium]